MVVMVIAGRDFSCVLGQIPEGGYIDFRHAHWRRVIFAFKEALALHIDDFTDEIKTARPKYTAIAIPKKTGGERKIFMPNETTAKIQRAILADLYELNLGISSSATAFVKGKSIKDNANQHLGQSHLIHYDLRDFFDTITFKKVEPVLLSRGVDRNFIKTVKKWCFVEGHLPQGAPTSPLLSNLVCQNLDYRFAKLAEKIGATYTRYADDIIISGTQDIVRYQTIFKRIIRTEKFYINYRKIRISVLDKFADDSPNNWFVPWHIITGLTVNADKVSVRPAYINKVKRELQETGVNPSTTGKIGFIKFVDFDIAQILAKYLPEDNQHLIRNRKRSRYCVKDGDSRVYVDGEDFSFDDDDCIDFFDEETN